MVATRATIWQKKPDGYRGVYLHWSEPDDTEGTLKERYNTEALIDALLDPVFNDSKYLSDLGGTPSESIYRDDPEGRDSWTGVQATAEERFARSSREHGCDYLYDWDGEEWQTWS